MKKGARKGVFHTGLFLDEGGSASVGKDDNVTAGLKANHFEYIGVLEGQYATSAHIYDMTRQWRTPIQLRVRWVGPNKHLR